MLGWCNWQQWHTVTWVFIFNNSRQCFSWFFKNCLQLWKTLNKSVTKRKTCSNFIKKSWTFKSELYLQHSHCPFNYSPNLCSPFFTKLNEWRQWGARWITILVQNAFLVLTQLKHLSACVCVYIRFVWYFSWKTLQS